jgi:flagellar hook protein FlgE
MSNYNVAFSGLDNVSKAIDTVSNNIANANTVGYKAGQWVFADQFMRASRSTDAARAGMGAQNLSVRRPMIQGTLQSSSNPLDLAISGKGMFRLLSDSGLTGSTAAGNVDPSSLYYTRNGQFSVNRQGYIVNENGMYLTGYQTSPDGSISDVIYGSTNVSNNDKYGRLKMPATNLLGNRTTESRLASFLDSTATVFTDSSGLSFDPSQTTYNNKTSQTVFDNEGNPHTLEVYYRRVEDKPFTITATKDGYTYSPSDTSLPNTEKRTQVELSPNSILRVDTAPINISTITESTRDLDTDSFDIGRMIESTQPVDTTIKQGMRIFINGVDSGRTVSSKTNIVVDGVELTTVKADDKIKVDKGAKVSFYPTDAINSSRAQGSADKLQSFKIDKMTNLWGKADTGVKKDMKVFINGVDSGSVLTKDPTSDATSDTIEVNPAISFEDNAKISFFAADYAGTTDINLDMTLITQDGTEIPVQGLTNEPQASATASVTLTTNTARVEVYASIDSHFYNYSNNSPETTFSDKGKFLNPDLPGGYNPVSIMKFIGGRNIDGLVTDPQSGNPTFSTVTSLTHRFKNPAGGDVNLVFDLDLTDTQLGAGAFQVTKSVQNGEPMSKLTNITVDNQGRIAGVYGNGITKYVGQVALVHFDAFEKLAPAGKNAFSATVESGTEEYAEGVLIGRPGSGELGEIKSQSLESSNVDLSSELVRLMILQRSYSANSQSMKAVDQVMRDTLQMTS